MWDQEWWPKEVYATLVEEVEDRRTPMVHTLRSRGRGVTGLRDKVFLKVIVLLSLPFSFFFFFWKEGQIVDLPKQANYFCIFLPALTLPPMRVPFKELMYNSLCLLRVLLLLFFLWDKSSEPQSLQQRFVKGHFYGYFMACMWPFCFLFFLFKRIGLRLPPLSTVISWQKWSKLIEQQLIKHDN